MNAKLFDAMLRHGIGLNPWYFEKHADSPNFPPHNITQIGENSYRLTLAVAGFTQDELQISLQFSAKANGPLLTIIGKKNGPGENIVYKDTYNDASFETDLVQKPSEHYKILYRGIAYRDFTREFLIGENVEVESARLQHGLLEIDLVRHVPESHKPKLIRNFDLIKAGRGCRLLPIFG